MKLYILKKPAWLLAAFIAAALMAAGAHVRAGERNRPPVVVELFTSQGCSSCPAADDLLAELAAQPGILALSWAVDYWDYLGWKDTFGEKVHTLRQRAYNESLGRHVIYTPQIIVDGRLQIIGSRKTEVLQAVGKMRQENAMRVPARLTRKGQDWYLTLGEADMPADAAIRMIWFDSARSVPVKRGENRGRTLRYTHIVRGSQVVGSYDGKAQTIKLPMLDMKAMKCDGLAVLVQAGGVGPVLGADMAMLH